MSLRLFFILLLLVLNSTVTQARDIQTPFIPPAGKTLFIIGGDPDAIAHYVSAFGQVPGGTTFYTSVQRMEDLSQSGDVGSGPMYGDGLLATYPDSVIHIGLYMVGAMKDTAAGVYDANLRALAEWIKKANRPVYLRIGYEFDNPDNHYDPQEYKRGFRYVVDFLRKEGVHNAAYVWHSQCWQKSPQEIMQWYPGDDYVDWFAASLFSMPAGMWFTSDFIKLAREHHKPVMIAESSTWGMYTVNGKLDWLNRFFQFIKDQKVEAICYFNYDWDKWPMWNGMHIGDGRVEENAETKKLWSDEISQERYLKASKDLFRSLGW